MGLTVWSVRGGKTMVFSMVFMTSFHNSFSTRFSTVFSQILAKRVRLGMREAGLRDGPAGRSPWNPFSSTHGQGGKAFRRCTKEHKPVWGPLAGLMGL